MGLKYKTFEWGDIQFDEIDTIESDGTSPRLYKTPLGNYPSMTSLLSILDDGGLQGWIDYVGQDEADRICKEAADRGNALHDYNEMYLKNELQRSDLKGSAKILFNRVKHYLDQIQLVLATEVALYSDEFGYAGRVDAVGFIDDKLMIIDHKNSRKNINLSLTYGRRKLFSYMLQCTGYRRALYEMTGLKASHGCLIVGNYNTSSSSRFVFEIDDFLEEELTKVITLYKYPTAYEEHELQFFKIGTDEEQFPKLCEI